MTDVKGHMIVCPFSFFVNRWQLHDSSQIAIRCTLHAWPDFRSASATPPCAERWERNMSTTNSTREYSSRTQGPHRHMYRFTTSDVMDFVQAFRRVFLACIPHPIEPDWDPVYAPRLAGFPVNICYASLRGESGPEYATYCFAPHAPSQKTRTSEECGTTRGTRVHSGSRWSAARATDTSRLANTAEKNWYAWLPVEISGRP